MANEQEASRRSWSSSSGQLGSVAICLLAISVILNVVLAQKISAMKFALTRLGTEGGLQIGTVVPPLVGKSVEGLSETLNYADVPFPTVLYVFSPSCGWSKKNVDNLRALISNSGTRYRVIGVSLTTEGLAQYLTNEHMSLPIYTDISEAMRIKYKFGATPSTIIISSKSTVLRSWTGAYQDSVRKEIEAYLRVSLPGCCKNS